MHCTARLAQFCQLVFQRWDFFDLVPKSISFLPELPERIFLRGQLPLRLRLFFLQRGHIEAFLLRSRLRKFRVFPQKVRQSLLRLIGSSPCCVERVSILLRLLDQLLIGLPGKPVFREKRCKLIRMRLSLPLRILPFCIQLLRAFLYMRILRSPFAQRADCLGERLR